MNVAKETNQAQSDDESVASRRALVGTSISGGSDNERPAKRSRFEAFSRDDELAGIDPFSDDVIVDDRMYHTCTMN